MRKIYVFLSFFILLTSGVKSQNLSTYAFNYSTAVGIEDISSGSSLLIGSSVDDASSAVVNLPFTFNFAGGNFNQFSVSSNGMLGFGATPVDFNYWDYALIESLTYPVVAGWSDDLYTASDGGVSYKTVTLSNGKRKVVIEWRVRSFTDRSVTTANKLFQVWLFEGSNKIQFVYGAAAYYRYNNASIGVANSQTEFINVNAHDHTASTTVGNQISNNWPGEGSSYSFTPPGAAMDPITVSSNHTISNISCNGGNNGSIQIGTISGGDGSYTINWSGPNGYTASGTTLQNLYAGTYSYTVTDNSASTPAVGDVQVTQPPVVTVSITASGPTSFCQGSSVALTASTAASYLWSNGATTQSITIASAGDYSVEITDANGCKATSAIVTTTVYALPIASITASGPTSFCQGSSVALTASSATSYLWSNGATSQSITIASAGDYSVEVTDANGCKATSATITTTVTALAVSITASGPTSFCQGSSVALTASSATSYLWSNGATSQSITITSAGDHSVQITDANGCKATSSTVTTSVNALPTVSISTGSDKDLLCSGMPLTASSSAISPVYTWSNGASSNVIYLTNKSSDGLYSVSVTDQNGCSSATAATYTLRKQDLTGSYTVVGLTSISLGSGTTVAKGSVGVTGSAGTISLGSNSSVAAAGAVVKAKSITVSSPVNAPTLIYAPATLVLPPMQYNTSNAGAYGMTSASGTVTLNSNYKSITIKAGSNVTLTGDIFGSVTVESGATLTFTKSTVNIDKLIVSTSKATATTALANVRFANNSSVRFSTSIYLYGRSRINPDNNEVDFYLADANTDAESFTISGLDTKFSGTVQMPVGTLAVTGTDVSTTTVLSGRFIAEKITSSGSKVIWQAACETAPAITSTSSSPFIEVENPGLHSAVRVYPNLTSGQFNVQLNETALPGSSVKVYDNSGRIVAATTAKGLAREIISFNLSHAPSGFYVVSTTIDGKTETSKLMIQR
jgi:hypothetical protein